MKAFEYMVAYLLSDKPQKIDFRMKSHYHELSRSGV